MTFIVIFSVDRVNHASKKALSNDNHDYLYTALQQFLELNQAVLKYAY